MGYISYDFHDLLEEMQSFESAIEFITRLSSFITKRCDGMSDQISNIKKWLEEEEDKHITEKFELESSLEYFEEQSKILESDSEFIANEKETLELMEFLKKNGVLKMDRTESNNSENIFDTVTWYRENARQDKEKLKDGNLRWLYELTIENMVYNLKFLRPKEVVEKMEIAKNTYYSYVRQIHDILPWTKELLKIRGDE